jgi:deleted-in-malignant-brain-tumors protein 1
MWSLKVLLVVCGLLLASGYTQQHGDLRLAGYGSNSISGRLEIYFNGQWGTVCGDVKFNTLTASVACRQLGLGPSIDVTYYPDLRFGIGEGPINIGEVVCAGTESHILKCGYKSLNQLNCPHHRDVGIICSSVSLPYSGSLKLTGSLYSSSGILQLYLYNQWRIVCSANFDQTTVDVVCKQLGYTNTLSYNDSLLSGTNVAPTWIIQPSCARNATCLGDCNTTLPTSVESIDDCPSNSALMIQCGFDPNQVQDISHDVQSNCQLIPTTPYRGEIRTIPSSPYLIVPEIYIGDSWKMVCYNDQFTNMNADVLCKQLGFSIAIQIISSESNGLNEGVLISCNGLESSVMECSLFNVSSLCTQFVSLKCSNEYPSYGSLRLTDSSGSSGSLQVFGAQQFLPLCDTHFGVTELEVACRQLGYSSGLQIVNNSLHGILPINSPYQYDITCTGRENYLLECKLHPTTCNHYDTVAIQCGGDSNPTVGSAIRLNGGNNTSGRLEVSLDGDKSWGCVCGLHFDHLSAHVACRQLGFDTAVGYHYTDDNASPDIALTSVSCYGFESNLFSCPHMVADDDTCRPEHSVYLYCSKEYPVKEGALRLVSTNSNPLSGRLEISYHGLWMTICGEYFSDKSFSRNAADVACRQLGYPGAASYCTTCHSDGGASEDSLVFLADLDCSGDEHQLIDCEKEIYNRNFCNHSNDVYITCSDKVISSVSEPVQTPIITTTPDPTPLPLGIIYGLSIGGGGLLLVALCILSSVICCCLCRRSRKRVWREGPVEGNVTSNGANTAFNIYDSPNCVTGGAAALSTIDGEVSPYSDVKNKGEGFDQAPPPQYDEIVDVKPAGICDNCSAFDSSVNVENIRVYETIKEIGL